MLSRAVGAASCWKIGSMPKRWPKASAICRLETISGPVRWGLVGGRDESRSLARWRSAGGKSDHDGQGPRRGFGFLRNATIDQHVIARGRLDDLIPVIKRYPHLLGLGIDEGAAVVVRGDRMEIMGRSKVAVYDHKRFEGSDKPYLFLKPGDVFNLRSRTIE